VGSNFALSAMLMATLVQNHHWSGGAAIAVALAAGTFIGALNGFITVRTGIPSFITTLGAFMFWRGVVIAFTGGWPITLAEAPKALLVLSGKLGESAFHSSFLWWMLAALVVYTLLEHTPYGNWTFATGGKPESAYARGIPTGRIRIFNFGLTGFLAALAGVVQLARLESMSPTDGTGMELEAIAATVIGGTSLFGGRGTVLGTVLGTILMGMLSTGLVLAGAPTYWFRAFIGLIIIVAVVFNTKFEAYAARAR
jgi:simple sugar transport system permease protein